MVWYTARRLHEALAGRTLTRSDFRVPRLATADLTGDVVIETIARGKHLLTRTKNGLTVHTHLRMDGSWRVRPAAEPLRDSHRIRLVLANDDWQAVGYQLGVVELIRTSEESQVTGHLGPDLLGPDWDCAEAVRRLAAEPGRPIGEALLDQRNLAGIGKLYGRDAVPARRQPVAARRRRRGLGAMAELARRLLEANKDRIGQVTTGDARPGRGDLGVRAARPSVPTLRDADPEGRAGSSGPGTAQVLVPVLPEIALGAVHYERPTSLMASASRWNVRQWTSTTRPPCHRGARHGGRGRRRLPSPPSLTVSGTHRRRAGTEGSCNAQAARTERPQVSAVNGCV